MMRTNLEDVGLRQELARARGRVDQAHHYEQAPNPLHVPGTGVPIPLFRTVQDALFAARKGVGGFPWWLWNAR
ncbi:hypothetical protein [Nitrosomonas sp. GH22]|nr:hypothetical protein [Nitrosomonas sp. GH22]